MKIEAGWKLWARKPSEAPAVSAARIAAPGTPRSNAITANAIPSIVHSPAARPSTPSVRLTTFMSTTSHNTVRAPPALGN
jgi:hypothetical protein